jgi:hypothetical protein
MEHTEYANCQIINIRRNVRTGNLHATLVDKDGKLLISATLDYITKALTERFSK